MTTAAAPSLRVAIAHDYLTQRGGAERVVLALSRIFPDAPIYTTLFEPDGTYPEFAALDVRVSWLNRIGVLRRHHRLALPLLAAASSSIVIDADVVIVSSSGWAHGFRTKGRTLVYCYSPARWLYEPERYLGEGASRPVRWALAAMSPLLRRWDKRAARRADRYLAISTVTQDRIDRTYGRRATIVAAPHHLTQRDREQQPAPAGTPKSYFLLVSRLLPYKNVMPVVLAFNDRPHLNLVIVGRGPQKPELRQAAAVNVTFLEGLSDAEMIAAYQGCTALVAASNEDFGLTPLEAAMQGKPSAVLRWGGFLDTMVEGQTTVFFDEATPHLIGKAIDKILDRQWDETALRCRAEQFSEPVFANRIREQVSILAGEDLQGAEENRDPSEGAGTSG